MELRAAFLAMSFLVMAMVVVDAHGRLPRAVYGVLKLLASAVFVGTGFLLVGVETWPARFFVGALVLSLVGDALLIPAGKSRIFLAGLVAFLLAHVAYIPAFALRGLDPVAFLVAAGATAVPAWRILLWLRPKAQGAMWPAVVAYVVVICAMLAAAVAAVVGDGAGAAPGFLLVLGALAFWLSDILVARQRFVKKGLVNRVFGVPLYFFGQLLLVAGFSAP